MARRHFGTIRKLPSGRWQAKYRAAGKLVPAPRTFTTKGEAAVWLSSVETDLARGNWVDPKAGKLTLTEYAWAWLRGHVGIGPRTREIYESQLRLYVLPPVSTRVPALGDKRLVDITPELVREWYRALRDERSASVAAKSYTRLRQILAQAVEDERIARNPCKIDGGGVERSGEQRFPTIADLYEIANLIPRRYRALILLAGFGGLRQGELFALRRGDVDLERGTVRVERKRLRLQSGEVIEDDPKSAAGRRTVSVPEAVTEELERHLDTFCGPGDDDYVFTSPEGYPLERSNFRYRVWVPATEAAGLAGLRFHDLRHAAGTLAARTGATAKELMARLGHSSSRAAMIYQHAAEERDRLIAERLDAMIAEERQLNVVAIEKAVRKRSETQAESRVARTLHEDGVSSEHKKAPGL
jgi:integrase